jgi:nickel transport protein
MRFLTIIVILLITFGAKVPEASAHRVNIFAYLDGRDIQVECAFNKSQKVRQGVVTVFDTVTNLQMANGLTDDEGIFRFPVPKNMDGHGLRVHINAGEGHQSEWIMSADTLKTAGQPERISTEEIALTQLVEDLERLINNSLDTKLAPLKQMLVEQFNSGPKVSEIIGGIGWIFGLFGVAAYFKRRR